MGDNEFQVRWKFGTSLTCRSIVNIVFPLHVKASRLDRVLSVGMSDVSLSIRLFENASESVMTMILDRGDSGGSNMRN
jgi:hypothetical protein